MHDRPDDKKGRIIMKAGTTVLVGGAAQSTSSAMSSPRRAPADDTGSAKSTGIIRTAHGSSSTWGIIRTHT